MSGCLLVRVAVCSQTRDERKKVGREREREKDKTGRRERILRGKKREGQWKC